MQRVPVGQLWPVVQSKGAQVPSDWQRSSVPQLSGFCVHLGGGGGGYSHLRYSHCGQPDTLLTQVPPFAQSELSEHSKRPLAFGQSVGDNPQVAAPVQQSPGVQHLMGPMGPQSFTERHC